MATEGNNAEFGMVESFGIDHGELDGLTPAQCFCLGVEWQTYYEVVQLHQRRRRLPRSPMLLRSVNRARIEGLLKKHGIPHFIRWMNDDWHEVRFGGSGDDKTQASA